MLDLDGDLGPRLVPTPRPTGAGIGAIGPTSNSVQLAAFSPSSLQGVKTIGAWRIATLRRAFDEDAILRLRFPEGASPRLHGRLQRLIQAREILPAGEHLDLLALHFLGHVVEMPGERFQFVAGAEIHALRIVALRDRPRRGDEPLDRLRDATRRRASR
jgi:hypothetical protein